MGFNGFQWVSMGFNGFQWVLLGFTVRLGLPFECRVGAGLSRSRAEISLFIFSGLGGVGGGGGFWFTEFYRVSFEKSCVPCDEKRSTTL